MSLSYMVFSVNAVFAFCVFLAYIQHVVIPVCIMSVLRIALLFVGIGVLRLAGHLEYSQFITRLGGVTSTAVYRHRPHRCHLFQIESVTQQIPLDVEDSVGMEKYSHSAVQPCGACHPPELHCSALACVNRSWQRSIIR